MHLIFMQSSLKMYSSKEQTVNIPSKQFNSLPPLHIQLLKTVQYFYSYKLVTCIMVMPCFEPRTCTIVC